MNLTNRFHKEISTIKMGDLSPVILEAFLKKLDEVGNYVKHSIFKVT